MQPRLLLLALLLLVSVFSAAAHGQFRRGLFSESTEITLYPLDPPALLLPAGSVQLEIRNASSASARIIEQLKDLFARQLTDNDARLSVVPKGGDLIVAVTLIDWRESRRSSTKYVSERLQVGTRQVRKRDGTTRVEPVYEYGRNKPSVEIEASAGLRVEVRRPRGAALADETVRHSISEEHLTEEGPPSREAVEDTLIDQVVQKGAARISPGRLATRVLLARSDDVDDLNVLARDRRWQDWLTALGAVKPHGDRRRDAYRLHNLAVANEAMAYESTTAEDWNARLNLASTFVRQAAAQNPSEKYITASAERIAASVARYQQLIAMFRKAGQAPAAAATRRAETPATKSGAAISAASGAASPVPATLTNQDIIDLRAAGLDDDNLIAAIADAKSVRFDLSPAALKALLAAKVSNRVISAMRARAKS